MPTRSAWERKTGMHGTPAIFFLPQHLLPPFLALTYLSPSFGAVVKAVPSLTQLHSDLSCFTSQLGDAHLEASFRDWKEAALETQLETKPQFEDGDQTFILEVMGARHDDIEWLTTRYD